MLDIRQDRLRTLLRHAAPLAAAWFLLTILPLSLVAAARVYTIASQRFLYIPSVGLAVVLGWAFAQMTRSRSWKVPVWCAAGVVLIALVVLSVRQSVWWPDNVRFWERFVKDTPALGTSYYCLGLAYHGAGHYRRAVNAYKAAIDLRYIRPRTYAALGDTYLALRDYARAAKSFEAAVCLAPRDKGYRDKLRYAVARSVP